MNITDTVTPLLAELVGKYYEILLFVRNQEVLMLCLMIRCLRERGGVYGHSDCEFASDDGRVLQTHCSTFQDLM
jgi:hypothetical protein